MEGALRTFPRLALAALVALALAPPARAADPYDIHVIATMTGISAFVGKYMKLNFDAFEDWVNAEGGIKGRPVHFIYDDDQTSRSSRCSLRPTCWRRTRPCSW